MTGLFVVPNGRLFYRTWPVSIGEPFQGGADGPAAVQEADHLDDDEDAVAAEGGVDPAGVQLTLKSWVVTS